MPGSPLIRSEHFSRSVLMPGLVNAHTHLELTGLENQAPDRDFAAWIRTVIRLKAERSGVDFLAAARRGLWECHAAGVTTVADTGDSGAGFQALVEGQGSGIAYLEVFGPDPAQAEAQFAGFRTRVLALRPAQTERVFLGVSPHAPYSVSGALYRQVAAFAREEELPIAVHIGESAAEVALLSSGTGSFAENWRSRGIPPPAGPGRTPLAWLEAHDVLGPATLCIHAVHADGEDVARMVRHRCSVAHCPRSNRRHGHGDAPLSRFLEAGLDLGVGTDSVASVHPVDLFAEVRAAAALGPLSPERALHLVMLGGAEALGLGQVIGTLEADKWADCVVVELPPGTRDEGVAAALLASRPDQVRATFISGREVHRR